MKDLISRQNAIEAVRKLSNAGIYWFVAAPAVFNALLKLPSAQPEIVRCKDCKYYKLSKHDGTFTCHYVIGAILRRNSDEFCSRAERKTDKDGRN